MTLWLCHHLAYHCRHFKYYDDSVVKMSQTPHDSPARHVTGGRLEPVCRKELDVSYLIDRETHVFVSEFGEHHRALLACRPARETRGEIDHRHDRPAQIEETVNVGRRAGKARAATQRHDLTDCSDVTPVHRAGDRKEQKPQRVGWTSLSRYRGRSQSDRAGPGNPRASGRALPPRGTV